MLINSKPPKILVNIFLKVQSWVLFILLVIQKILQFVFYFMVNHLIFN